MKVPVFLGYDSGQRLLRELLLIGTKADNVEQLYLVPNIYRDIFIT